MTAHCVARRKFATARKAKKHAKSIFDATGYVVLIVEDPLGRADDLPAPDEIDLMTFDPNYVSEDDQPPDWEIVCGHDTVWVNWSDGMCVGRFSPRGVDVHRSFAEQAAGMPQCLDCCHDLPYDESWGRFQASMLKHYNVPIPDHMKPEKRP